MTESEKRDENVLLIPTRSEAALSLYFLFVSLWTDQIGNTIYAPFVTTCRNVFSFDALCGEAAASQKGGFLQQDLSAAKPAPTWGAYGRVLGKTIFSYFLFNPRGMESSLHERQSLLFLPNS